MEKRQCLLVQVCHPQSNTGAGVQSNRLLDNEKHTTQPSQTTPNAKETIDEGAWFWNDTEQKWLAKKAHEMAQPSQTKYTLPMGC
eukprot:8614579-Ditylum_brightwellii.AAC.1